MSLLIQYLEIIIYVIVFTLLGTGVRLLTANNSGYIGRLRILGYRNTVPQLKQILNNYLRNEDTEKLFRDAGFPLRLTGLSFSFLRVSIFITMIMVLLFKWIQSGGPLPYSSAALLTATYLLTSTHTNMPAAFLLKKIKKLHDLEKNRECFLFYSMLLNEFYMEDGKPYNMYSVLLKFMPYFDKIKPALYKSTANWKRDPDKALDLLANEIGTEEAYDLAQILKTVDAANAEQARDILKSRYEQFQTARHEQHRRMLKNIDLIGYIIVFVPTIAILFNMVFVLGIAVQSLLERLNYH